jgi:tetratricopeptide (TPR) repeat protein
VKFYPDFLSGGIVDTAIILGAGMIIALNFLVFGPKGSKWQKLFYAVIVVGALLFAGAINFKPFIILVAIFSLAHFVYAMSMSKMAVNAELLGGTSESRASSPFSLFVLVVSLVLILGGSSFSGFLSRTLKISNIDVRPNISSTMNLVIDGWKANPLIGIGPNKFSNLWNQNRPDGVNLTNFWSTDFASGFGYVPTLVAETGVLGTAAFLAFLVLFARLGFRAIFSHHEDPRRKLMLTSSFFTALYFWVMSFIYTSSIAVIGLSFLFTGIFISALVVFDVSRRSEVNLFGNPKLNFASVFVIVVLIISTIAGGYFTWERITASTVFARGEQALNTGDTAKAAGLFAKAALMANSETYWRATANSFLLLLQNKMNSIGSAQAVDEATRAEIQNYIGNAVLSADNAVKADRKNYLNYFVLGNIYESLAARGMPDAAGLARQNYEEARKYSPKNPGIPLVMARLSMTEGKADAALAELDQSLALKPNFTDAFFMKAQIEVLRNNIMGAIKSVEDATLVDPFNAGLYFQLGLLKYNVRDWRGAAAAFERAVAIVPNYANAKYFLGLTYDTLGRGDEATAQFEDLTKSNPDNQEVKFILENLKAGRDPFSNAKPPIDEKPEKRSEPPLEEN